MIVRSLPEWKEVVRKIRASRDPIFGECVASYDTETHDEGFPDTYIVGFSMAWYECPHGVHTKAGAYIPIQHKTGEMQLPPEAIRDDLASLLEDPEIRIVQHNAPYDILQSRTLGIDINENIDDTMVMAMMLNTNGIGSPEQILTGNGLKGLKDLSEFYFGHTMQELTKLAPRVPHPTDPDRDLLLVEKVPIAKLGPYAWDDGIQTLSLWELFWIGYEEYEQRYPEKTRKLHSKYRAILPDVMKGLLNLPGQRNSYEKIEREFAFALADMQEFGICLNVGKIEEMRDAVAEERRTLAGEMFNSRPGESFPVRSDSKCVKQCAEQYQRLEDRFSLPKDHPEYPTRVVTKGKGRGKARKTWTEKEPYPVGTARSDLFKTFDLKDTPVEDLIRDDAARPFVIEHPHLAHKIFNLNSTKQLQEIFFAEIGVPILGRTKGGDPSTKGDYIEEWAAMDYPMMRPMHRYREIDKLYGTYMVGMPKKVASDGRIRTRYGRVRTWRLSSMSPNLQNIPTSDEFPIRVAFEAHGILHCDVDILAINEDNEKPLHVRVQAREGNPLGLDGGWEMKDGRIVAWWGSNPPWAMMVADYSQLEIRLLAFISRDPVLVGAVISGQDIHALTARAVFDEIPDDMPLSEVKEKFGKKRKDAKPVSFGVIYGMGAKTLALTLDISYDEAKVLIEERYMGYYKGVKLYIDKQHRFVVVKGHVKYVTGRKRHLPEGQLDPNALCPSGDLDRRGKPKTQWYRVAGAQRQAQNSPIQGFASDVIGLAMRDVRRWLRSTKLSDLNGEVMPGVNGEILTSNKVLFRNYARTLLQVHDELVNEYHPAIANYCMDRSVDLMETPGGLKLMVKHKGKKVRIPLDVDAAIGADWFNTKE